MKYNLISSKSIKTREKKAPQNRPKWLENRSKSPKIAENKAKIAENLANLESKEAKEKGDDEAVVI